MALLNQYAKTVINSSSQFDSVGWSAKQALGFPNAISYGDNPTSWEALAKNGTLETLTLGFATPVYATGVVITESNGNGFVTKIEVLSAVDNSYSQVWTGTDNAATNTIADFTASFGQTPFLVNGIRITVDTNHNLNSYEQIDAVKLLGDTTPPVMNYGFDISSNGDLTTDENGDTAVFTVKLTAAPVRDVSITFSSLNTLEGTVSNASLTFTSANWSTAQSFTVTGQDDSTADGNISYQVKATVTSIDINYSDLTLPLITLTNNDNEVAGLTIYGDNGGSKADIVVGGSGDDKIFGKDMKDDLSGGAGNDELYGGYENDVLFGENGNDKLYGEEGSDYMEGGAGNDSLDGGLSGLDTLIGGAGNDTYYLGYDAVDNIQDNGLSTDVDTVIMPYLLTTYTLPTGIENGTIDKGSQNSNLSGNTGNNGLTGNDGVNILNGAVGRDSLFGGNGNDVLIGGTDNDTLNGGAGRDIFKLLDKSSVDNITDFKVVDDTVQIENNVFTKLGNNGTLKADMFKTGTAAVDSNDYLIYNPNDGKLYYDADGSGSGSPTQIALLGVSLNLTNADFVVI
jgi:Ca2+-binding RTX toxin-like protein